MPVSVPTDRCDPCQEAVHPEGSSPWPPEGPSLWCQPCRLDVKVEFIDPGDTFLCSFVTCTSSLVNELFMSLTRFKLDC